MHRCDFCGLFGSAADIKTSKQECVCLFASEAEKRQTSQMEKLYLRIPTSVDAITFTMQNGNYNAILLTKCVIDFSIYVL